MLVREERFICGYLCNKNMADDLLVLLSFYDEIARISIKTKEVSFMQIRLKWFMDGVQGLYSGKKTGFPLVDDLAAIINKYKLQKQDFITMLEARNIDKDYLPFNSLLEYINYAENTGGVLWKMVMQMYGGNATELEAAFLVGSAFAMTGIIRNYNFDRKRFHYSLVFNKQELLKEEHSILAVKGNVEQILKVAQEYLNKAEIIKVQMKLKRLQLLAIFTSGYIANIQHNLPDLAKINVYKAPFIYKLKFIIYYILKL